MRGVIIYRSRYGSTKQYAEWLREETGYDLFDAKHAPADLSGYDVVVLGSSVIAGRLSLSSWIRQHWAALHGKHLLLLMTHMREDPAELDKVLPQSLPGEMTEQITVFPVGGRYSLRDMPFVLRTIIKMMASREKNPEAKQQLLTDRDNVNKRDLRDLLALIRSLG